MIEKIKDDYHTVNKTSKLQFRALTAELVPGSFVSVFQGCFLASFDLQIIIFIKNASSKCIFINFNFFKGVHLVIHLGIHFDGPFRGPHFSTNLGLTQ